MSLPLPDIENESLRPPAALFFSGLLVPFLILVAGMALIATVNFSEIKTVSDQVWGDAVLVTERPPLDIAADRAIPVAVWDFPKASLSGTDLLSQLNATPQGRELITLLGLDETERVLLISAPLDVLGSLLESGRMPEPGTYEALAGDMAQRDSFDFCGESFRVVGRIARGVAALRCAYIVPDDAAMGALFAESEDVTQGWLDPEGESWLDSEDPDVAIDSTGKIIAGPARTEPVIIVGTILGLVLIALGGSWIQMRVFRRLGFRRRGIFSPVLSEVVDHPILLGAMHVALYGVFFALMFTALFFPGVNFSLSYAVQNTFLEGDLSYIGLAYNSGDILAATAATFYHNYFVATLLLTLLPSLVIPFVGLLKNLVTFAVVGFVMSPIWTGSADRLVFHSVTMLVEFEAYIIATFAIVVFPIRFVGAFRGEDLWGKLLHAFGVIVSAALLSGVILILAALYEAASLILLV